MVKTGGTYSFGGWAGEAWMDGEGKSGAVANPEAEVETVEEGAGLVTGMEVERSCTFSLLPISSAWRQPEGWMGLCAYSPIHWRNVHTDVCGVGA